MDLPFHTLLSQASGPNHQILFLNADNFGNVTVQYSQQPTSEWFTLYNPANGGVMFVNVASGMALTVNSDNATLSMTNPSSPTDHNSWTIQGNAIRPVYNDDLNLNVQGNSYPAGTHVIVYKWDNQSNSKWNFDHAASLAAAK
jgi:hypothetical protein